MSLLFLQWKMNKTINLQQQKKKILFMVKYYKIQYNWFPQNTIYSLRKCIQWVKWGPTITSELLGHPKVNRTLQRSIQYNKTLFIKLLEFSFIYFNLIFLKACCDLMSLKFISYLYFECIYIISVLGYCFNKYHY